MKAIDVTESGVTIIPFREIREEIASRMKELFGQELNTSPSSPDGQLIDLFGLSYSNVVEALQHGFSMLDPNSAQGIFLDNIAMIAGVSRKENESDGELLERLKETKLQGLATPDGMRSYLKQVIDSSVALEVNCEDYTDKNGIPPHRISVFLPLGLEVENDKVAQAIFDCKPEGIKTFGDLKGIAKDKNGREYEIYFTKVQAQEFFLKISIAKYNEETLPSDYEERIKSAVISFAEKEMGAGKDIIPQRFIGAIYNAVDGIENISVEAAVNYGDWKTDRIAIPNSAYAVIIPERIEVHLL